LKGESHKADASPVCQIALENSQKLENYQVALLVHHFHINKGYQED